MLSRDFCYWLQGHFELSDSNTLSEKQVQQIKNHLGMVFKHEIDPSFGGKEVQEALHKIHVGSQTPSILDAVAAGLDDLRLNC